MPFSPTATRTRRRTCAIPAAVRTLIDDALLPQLYVPGTKVHLLHDPNDASILAVGRVRTLLEIPPASG